MEVSGQARTTTPGKEPQNIPRVGGQIVYGAGLGVWRQKSWLLLSQNESVGCRLSQGFSFTCAHTSHAHARAEASCGTAPPVPHPADVSQSRTPPWPASLDDVLIFHLVPKVATFNALLPIQLLYASYVYWTVHHLYSCVKRKTNLMPLILLFTQYSFIAQHVSAVNTTIFRSLRLTGCYFMGGIWFGVCWRSVSVWLTTS